MIGIYCFTNLINNKQYIGQSIDILNRKNQHYYRYKNLNDTGYNMPIHLAFRKYGWNNFSFEILEECSIEELDKKEIYWIKKKNTLSPNGYNVLPGGQNYKQKQNLKKYICPECGKEKTSTAELCWDCYNKKRHTNMKIPEEDINLYLIERILDSSLEQVAREYGYTSGNALKKQLINHNFPSKKEQLFQYYKEQTGKDHWKIIKQKQKEENRKKCQPKKVGCFSLTGELLKTYPSTRAAITDGFHSGGISECCNGKRKRYKNYIWKYI